MMVGLVEFRSTREVAQPAVEAPTTTTTSPAHDHHRAAGEPAD